MEISRFHKIVPNLRGIRENDILFDKEFDKSGQARDFNIKQEGMKILFYTARSSFFLAKWHFGEKSQIYKKNLQKYNFLEFNQLLVLCESAKIKEWTKGTEINRSRGYKVI